MSENVFEPMVMFFGLTNSLVTFQMMINNLLRDMIEIRDIIAFIDDVMVEMDIEEEYDNIVEEVLRRITENDLFVKPEKYVWKIREVGFLVGPDGINMERRKVQRVVD